MNISWKPMLLITMAFDLYDVMSVIVVLPFGSSLYLIIIHFVRQLCAQDICIIKLTRANMSTINKGVAHIEHDRCRKESIHKMVYVFSSFVLVIKF